MEAKVHLMALLKILNLRSVIWELTIIWFAKSISTFGDKRIKLYRAPMLCKYSSSLYFEICPKKIKLSLAAGFSFLIFLLSIIGIIDEKEIIKEMRFTMPKVIRAIPALKSKSEKSLIIATTANIA